MTDSYVPKVIKASTVIIVRYGSKGSLESDPDSWKYPQ